MRAYLFRGKRKDNRKWVEGGYYKEPYSGKVFIVCWNSTGMGYDELIEVDPSTVGQYTGRPDRNGKRIFEGDAVRTRYGRLCQIVWFESNCHNGWDMVPLEDINKTADKWDLWAPVNLTVVGNIHDNPELNIFNSDDVLFGSTQAFEKLRELIGGTEMPEMTERDKHLPGIQYEVAEEDLLDQLAEEAAELIHAIMKVKRAKPGSSNPTSTSLKDAHANFTEEAVDVLNALYALGGPEYFALLLIKHRQSPKWKRWAERIENAENN